MMPRRQAGFTLIEVIIAIMIMAIISLISWRAIDSVALTSRKLDQHTDDALALQRAFDQFERDVAARSLVLAEPPAAEAPAAPGAEDAEPAVIAPQLLPDAIHVSGMKTPAPRIDIVRAVEPGEPHQTLPFVRPGGEILLKIEGWPKVEDVLRHVDAIEAIGIHADAVSPEHWRHVHNHMAVGHQPRAYTAEQHRAFLLRRRARS